MNAQVKKSVDRLREIGMNYTFDGEYVADFIDRLDKIIEIRSVEFTGSILNIWVGNPIECNTIDLLKIITKSTLLNIQAAGYDTTPEGIKLYFEWYISPWDEKV